MDIIEMKKHFLPILQKIQLDMANLKQEGLVCEIYSREDSIHFGIHQFFTNVDKVKCSIQNYCDIYEFRSIEENEYYLERFKSKIKQQLGIII